MILHLSLTVRRRKLQLPELLRRLDLLSSTFALYVSAAPSCDSSVAILQPFDDLLLPTVQGWIGALDLPCNGKTRPHSLALVRE